MQVFRSVIIDPETQTIRKITTTGDRAAIKELLGTTFIDQVRVAEHDDTYDYAWVDEFGLAKHQPVHAFKFKGFKYPIAGKAVLIGYQKSDTEVTDVQFPTAMLVEVVEWLGVILPEVTWDENKGVLRSIVTYSRIPENG